MNFKIAFVTLGAIIGAQGLLAQNAPFPGAVNVNGGWVPCNHTIAINAGLGCSGNPGYDYPPDTPVQRDTFVPGQTIRQPYPIIRALVISVTTDENRTIVTARITRSNGLPKVDEYVAFDAARTQWFPLEIHYLP
jgi:hypothetical protein